MQQAAPVGRDESVSSDVHSALQALGLEVLQLLQCLLEHNPGVVSTSQGCSFEGWKGSPALLASSQRSRQGASVGCLPAGMQLLYLVGLITGQGEAAAYGRVCLMLALQGWPKLSQAQSRVLLGARNAILLSHDRLFPQRAALASQLQVRHVRF